MDLKSLNSEIETDNEAHAVLIRHAQSEGNLGLKTSSTQGIKITELGKIQANLLAQSWSSKPSSIVHSPYIRTRETAQPTAERFSNSPIVQWPIQEFTYLCPERYNNTTQAERKKPKEEYWLRNDPDYRDADRSESFTDFWERAVHCWENVISTDPGKRIFSHEQFINLIRFMRKFPEFNRPSAEAMKSFKIFTDIDRIPNTARVEIRKTLDGIWVVEEPKIDHLQKGMITF